MLDVNVLIALAWPNHLHHRAAHAWYAANKVNGWATCLLTQAGFVRVSSNRRVLPGAKTPAEAFQALAAMTRLPEHVFLSGDFDLSQTPYVYRDRILGYQQVSDAVLLAIALSANARVATFDRGMKHLIPADRAGAVVEIPA